MFEETLCSKQNEVCWLDILGLNSITLRGISRFKSGLNAKNVYVGWGEEKFLI